MKIIEPHIHMISRTTDDYLKMTISGIHTVAEPAFWPGFNRSSVDSFRDYFQQLTVTEHARAARFGVSHYCWIGMNSKEAEDIALSREVLAVIPEYLGRPTALGFGEIGLNKNSRNEITILQEQLRMAAERDALILIHTPHLEDKRKGTLITIDLILNEPRIRPSQVLFDHAEEHTIEDIKDRGFWYGLTLYPHSKGSPERAVDVIEMYGADNICINSSADWSVSDPLATLKTANEMRRRGHPFDRIHKVFYENPGAFLGQCPKFQAA